MELKGSLLVIAGVAILGLVAMHTCAMEGCEDIIAPQKNNTLPPIQYASHAKFLNKVRNNCLHGMKQVPGINYDSDVRKLTAVRCLQSCFKTREELIGRMHIFLKLYQPGSLGEFKKQEEWDFTEKKQIDVDYLGLCLSALVEKYQGSVLQYKAVKAPDLKNDTVLKRLWEEFLGIRSLSHFKSDGKLLPYSDALFFAILLSHVDSLIVQFKIPPCRFRSSVSLAKPSIPALIFLCDKVQKKLENTLANKVWGFLEGVKFQASNIVNFPFMSDGEKYKLLEELIAREKGIGEVFLLPDPIFEFVMGGDGEVVEQNYTIPCWKNIGYFRGHINTFIQREIKKLKVIKKRVLSQKKKCSSDLFII